MQKHNIEFIFGGSFDPIHSGHLNVIEALRKSCSTWPIRLLPCAVPALKNATSASFKQRVEMLRLATQSFDDLSIDERENRRNGKSYTVDSLQSFRQENPQKIAVLVVGGDALASMNQWYHWQQLADFCHLLVVNRPGAPLDKIEGLMQQLGFSCVLDLQKLEITLSGRYYCLTIEEKDISSTQVRTQLADGLSVDKFIPDCVNDYIKKQRIYQQETIF